MKKTFVFAILLLLSSCNRYQIKSDNIMWDRWTGRSWIFTNHDENGKEIKNGYWRKVGPTDYDHESNIVPAHKHTGETWVYTGWNGKSHIYTDSEKEHSKAEFIDLLF